VREGAGDGAPSPVFRDAAIGLRAYHQAGRVRVRGAGCASNEIERKAECSSEAREWNPSRCSAPNAYAFTCIAYPPCLCT